jgi:NhaC family Na+:H+ antiporter
MEAGEQHKISLALSSLPFLAAVISLFAAIFFLNVPIYLALMAGWITAFAISLSCGFRLRYLLSASVSGMGNTLIVVTILVLIGGVIAIWMASGTVAALIVYGVKLVVPQFLVVISFLLTFGMSMLLGTSVGTLSTMGIALAGIAHVMGIPSGLIGGALISGAMVGDRTSPLSGTLHLLAATTGLNSNETFRRIVPSAVPAFLICAVLYAWLGFEAFDPHISVRGGEQAITNLQSAFQLPPVVMIPPLLVLLLVMVRVPIRFNLALGILMGAVLAYFVQGRSLASIGLILWQGFAIHSAEGAVLLQGGGIWKMLNVVLIILTAGALNGILEASGMMRRLVGGLLERIKRESGLLVATALTSVAAGLIFCNQALMVIIPGRMLQPKYDEMHMHRTELARSLADSGVVTSALIPWNLHGILCATAMGIPTLVYWPYAFFLWLLPIFAILRGIFWNRLHPDGKSLMFP